MKYSVVLPAKNEAGAIGETIKKIQQLNMIDEIIVVNDGSTDTT
ncbi:MAG: glycosyltransferase, partial [Acinetobacter sp.]|nr:glycosyltransferase [Acinetobacter sp.]